MKSAQILKQKVSNGSLTLGVIATFHVWPGLIELLIRAGLDYVIIDLEHLTHDHEKVADMCALGRMLDFPVLLRPPAAEFTPLRLAIDLGPCGMLIPYVESVADLAVVQDAIQMKPRGRRRPGGPGNHWVSDYQYETWKTQVEDDFMILAQIESKVGLGNLAAIAAHPITTVMAIGPYDLSADLGVCWQPDHPLLADAFQKIHAAARTAGKPMWAIGDPQKLVAQGLNFICIGEPIRTLENALKHTVEQVRSAPKGSGR